MKLVAIAHSQYRGSARLVLALTCTEAERSLGGWRVEALRVLGVEVLRVELCPGRVAQVRAAQDRQCMTNTTGKTT
jgi:hypothetical protein